MNLLAHPVSVAEDGPESNNRQIDVQPENIGRQLRFDRMANAGAARCRANPSIEYIRLSVITDNTAAIDLYRSLGFEQYGCEPRSLKVNGEYYDEYLMIISTSGHLQSRSDDRK